ncbi:MAG TPA: DUF4382 domain-containing protein [Longimicrobiaceae bacterium]|nr:DUF4382 domain-containing protein [Longimicrobiaceae bacterium]
MRGINVTVLAAVLALGLGACDETTAPEGAATMQVAARGDDGAGSTSTGGGVASFSQSLSGAEGTVEFRARVWARTDAGEWVELTRRTVERVTVDASGRGEAKVFATTSVEAGGYNRVRVVFEEVQANVTGGIQIGLGGVLTGQVRVDLQSDSQVTVEREVDAEAEAGASTQLLIDLNSDAWLGSTNTQTRTVSEAQFQSAVRVLVR